MDELFIPTVVSEGDCFCLTIKVEDAHKDYARQYAQALLDFSYFPLPDKYWGSGSDSKSSFRREPYVSMHRKIPIPPEVKKKIGIPLEEKKKIGIPPEEKKKPPIQPKGKKKIGIPPKEMKKIGINSKEKKVANRPPRIRLNCKTNTAFGVINKDVGLEDVNFALERYNKANPGHEYALVEVFGGIFARLQHVHLNFIGKPVDESSGDEAMLCFAEVKRETLCGSHELKICQTCCILGPPGTATGLGGCETGCHLYVNGPHRIHHPEDGFTKKCVWG